MVTYPVPDPAVFNPNLLAQANAAPQKHGLELLDKARLELQEGNTKNARTLAEEAFQEQYRVRRQAESLLRTIDLEEWEQKKLAMNRNFDTGQLAYFSKDYKQAYATFLTLDEPPAHPATPDPATRDDGKQGNGGRGQDRRFQTADPSQRPGAGQGQQHRHATCRKEPGGRSECRQEFGRGAGGVTVDARPRVPEVDGGLPGGATAGDGRAKAHDFNTAVDILRSYAVSLESSTLSAERIAVLKRPIERRLGPVQDTPGNGGIAGQKITTRT